MNVIKINIKKYFKNGDFVIFIAVFFSSIVGAQILGVSLNKIALIPLELFLLFKMPYRININQTQKLFFYGIYLVFVLVLQVFVCLIHIR